MNKEHHTLLNVRTVFRIAALIATLIAEVTLPSSAMAMPTALAIVYPDTLKLPMRRYALRHAMRPARKTVGLALSGGGANALSQIGLLKALDEEGIPIDCIAGTSMGAIIGALYSCGYSPDELEMIAHTLPWQSMISYHKDYARSNIFLEQQKIRDRATIAIRFDKLKLLMPKSINSSQALTKTLDLLILNGIYKASGDFSTLPVNFRAVSTDLVSGRRVTLATGSLSEAIRASSTIPILFEPIMRDNAQLVDGGLVANLPVDELETLNADYKIAVDTHGSMYATGGELDLPWKAADQATTILTKLQYPAQLAKADIVITPDLGEHKATDFSDIKALVNAGYAQGKKFADTIKRTLENKSHNSTDIRNYTKTILYTEKEREFREHTSLVSPIIHHAADLAQTLRELLETDLFTSVHAELDSHRKAVLFHLEPLPEIRKITITGGAPEALSTEEITSCFSPVTKTLSTNAAGSRSLEALIKKYRNKGYSLVSIESVAIKDGTLQIQLSSGKANAIEIHRDKMITGITPIEREIKIDTTHPFSIGKADESVDNLYETGLFSRVSISAESTATQNPGKGTLLRFSLDEKPSSVLRLGLRYDETNNAQFLVDVRNENLAGTTSSIGGWLKAGKKSNLVNLEFNLPRIGPSHLTLSSRLFYDQHLFENRNNDGETKNYGIQKYGFSPAFGIRIRKNGQLMADMTLQNTQSYAEKSEGSALKTGSTNMLSIGTQFTLDSRDNPLVPSSGSYTHLRYSMTPILLDNRDIFWQVSGNHEENIRLGSKTTLQLSGLFGLSSSNMPLSEKFFLGGTGTPYSQRFIGLQENDLPCNNMAAAGMHLRYKPSFAILFPASVIMHYNVGNVWEELEDISSKQLMHGIGTSMIWETPLGPTRFTISKTFPFFKEANNTGSTSLRFSDTVFYFSIGHNF
jgi:NTE family protein